MSQTEDDRQERIFISYASQDLDAARRLYNDLKTQTNLKLWLDRESICAGQTWDLEIRNAIMKSRYFLALFSSTSVSKRGYLQNEFRIAQDKVDEFPESEIFVIPVRLDNCVIPYERFRNRQCVDMFPDWDKGVQALLRVFQIRQ